MFKNGEKCNDSDIVISARNLFLEYELNERTRPFTESEVSRLLITQQINNLVVDDATASRMVDYYPTLKQDGSQ